MIDSQNLIVIYKFQIRYYLIILNNSNPMKHFIFLTISFLTTSLGFSQSANSSTQNSFNSIWSWGDNSSGQLGQGNISTGNVLTLVSNDTNWIQIATGYKFSVAIKRNGTLWSWGENNLGQLGQGDTFNKNTPRQIGSDSNWKSISSGYSHTVALKKNGTIWTWGLNSHGQLGQGNTTSYNYPKQLGTDTNWKYISVGEDHTLAIKSDGTLWGWGLNGSGQLGLNNQTNYYTSPQKLGSDTSWSKIFTGSKTSAAIKTDGTLWMWGYSSNYFIQTQQQQTIYTNPQKIGTDTNWIEISIGYNHVLALKNNGTLWTWGSNNNGKLGLSNGQFVFSVPQQLGTDTTWSSISLSKMSNSEHSVAVKKDGTIWGWGINNFGQLGLGTPSYSANYSPIKINNQMNISQISTSSDFTLVIKKDGSLWSMGDNSKGQLGRTFYNSERSLIGIDTNWQQISNKDGEHTIGLKRNGTIWSWGKNTNGQLGIGNTSSTTVPQKIGNDSNWIFVSSSTTHSLAIKKNGTLWSWGNNSYGQLGIGNNSIQSAPIQVGLDSTWKIIYSGNNTSAGIKKDGTLWIWGSNSNGNLGLGNNTNYFNTPQKLGNDTNWAQISFGSFHTLAIKRNGTLWAWGAETNGQLGLGQSSFYNSPQKIGSDTNWIFVSASDYHSIALKSNGTIWSWGYNNKGQLGLGNYNQYNTPQKIGNDSNWKTVTAGLNSTFAIKNDSTLWAWGNNGYGQLGTGNNINYNSPQKVGVDSKWISIQLGNNFTIGLTRYFIKLNKATLCKPTNHIKLVNNDTLNNCTSLKLTSKNKSYSKYRWSTGDSSLSTVVAKSGLVTLRETDSKGCVNIDSVYVRIVKDEISQAPDTFLCNVKANDTLKLDLQNWFDNANVMYFDQAKNPVSTVNFFIKAGINKTWTGFAALNSYPSLKCPIKGLVNASVVYPRLANKSTDTIKTVATLVKPSILDAKYNKYRWSTGDTTRNITLQNSGSYWYAHYWNATINGVGRYCYQVDSFHLSRINLITPSRISGKLGSKIIIKVKDSLNSNSMVVWSNGDTGWHTVYSVNKNSDTLFATQKDAYRSVTKSTVITGRLEPIRRNEEINNTNYDTAINISQNKLSTFLSKKPKFDKPSLFEVFPIPATDKIIIEFHEDLIPFDYKIQIFDATGNIVYNQVINSKKELIYTNSWHKKGIYLIIMIDAKRNQVETKKIAIF